MEPRRSLHCNGCLNGAQDYENVAREHFLLRYLVAYSGRLSILTNFQSTQFQIALNTLGILKLLTVGRFLASYSIVGQRLKFARVNCGGLENTFKCQSTILIT